MKKTFTYTILHYKHSLLLNETINVGILFEFPEDDIIRFVEGDLTRVKSLYNNFDTPATHRLIRNIQSKAIEISKENQSLIRNFNPDELHKSLLRESDSSLQFSTPKTANYPFDDVEKTIEQYASLFLPNYNNLKVSISKQDESFILRTYTNLIFKENKELEIAANRNKTIESNGVKLKFDIGWENGTNNWVKPVSFDLKDESDIQYKSAAYFGYLSKLKYYGDIHNVRYDLIVWPPQDKSLYKKYDSAVEIIESADAPKRIITEEKLKQYSEETVEYLYKKYEKLKENL